VQVFFLILCGPQASPRRLRVYAGLRAHCPSLPRVFSAGLQVGPTDQALIATPIYHYILFNLRVCAPYVCAICHGPGE